jgi:hypothetical protein
LLRHLNAACSAFAESTLATLALVLIDFLPYGPVCYSGSRYNSRGSNPATVNCYTASDCSRQALTLLFLYCNNCCCYCHYCCYCNHQQDVIANTLNSSSSRRPSKHAATVMPNTAAANATSDNTSAHAVDDNLTVQGGSVCGTVSGVPPAQRAALSAHKGVSKEQLTHYSTAPYYYYQRWLWVSAVCCSSCCVFLK